MRPVPILAAALLLNTGVASLAPAAPAFQNVLTRATDRDRVAAAISRSLAGSTTQPVHGGLYVTFRESGLAARGTNYLVTADASATYGCVGRNGERPEAGDQKTVEGPVSAAATFVPGRAGTVNGAIAVAPLLPGRFNCAPGQTLVLLGVSYKNVVLIDVSTGLSTGLPGPYSRSF